MSWTRIASPENVPLHEGRWELSPVDGGQPDKSRQVNNEAKQQERQRRRLRARRQRGPSLR